MIEPLERLKHAIADRYALERELGRGGMATVFLARDIRHDRKVAVKLLHPELAAILGAERFLHEIKVTANLQHPHILPLFDSGEAGGLVFYVMPYIEGETLRQKLNRETQLPVTDAVRITAEVAEALDYAHRHGVVHRDIKPENILLQDGRALVADFGIALAVRNAGGQRLTETGLSLGTPEYMSPEQASGAREIDGRSDVYSLACVLYELLVGEPPHTGPTAQAIVAKILTEKAPRVRIARDLVPEHVDEATARALAKLPADRFHSAREFVEALSGPRSPAGAGTLPSLRTTQPGQTVSRLKSMAPWVITAGSLAVAGIAWGLIVAGRSRADIGAMRYEMRMAAGTALAFGGGPNVAVSPAGRFVAYTATASDNTRRLYVRAADELMAREVPGSLGARSPFFSPDGVWVAFWTNGQLRKAPVNGGAAVTLTELPTMTRTAWSGGWVITSDNVHLLRIPEAGGTAVPFTTPDSAHGETAQLNPVPLPDGKTLLYTALGMGGPSGSRIGVASLVDGSSQVLEIPGTFPLGVLEGHLIYSTVGGTIMAVPFDQRGRRATGAPVPLVDQVVSEVGYPLSYAAMSTDGVLVYATGIARRQLVYASRDGTVRPIFPEPGPFANPRLSPDGKHLAVAVGTATRSDVWVYDLPSGPFARLTTEGANNDRPEWMPDSRTVTFRSSRGALNSIWSQAIDGSSAAQPLYGQSDAKVDEGVVSADGRYLMFQRDRVGLGEVWYRAMEGDTTPRRVGAGAFGENGARFSPDGRWVAYHSSEAGARQVYVRPFPSLDARYQVSLNGGGTPVWSRDSRRIYYVADQRLVAATIGSTQPFTISARATVLDRTFRFNGTHADYDVSADGRTFVALRPPEQDVQLVVVHNWSAELRSRMTGSHR